MTDWQTPVALLVVLGATAYLARLAWRSHRARRAGCGSSGAGCGCSASAPLKARGSAKKPR